MQKINLSFFNKPLYIHKNSPNIYIRKTILVLLLCFLTYSVYAKGDKSEKKYTFDSFVKFVGTSSNENLNVEKYIFSRELESYYEQGKGYEPAYRFDKDDGLITNIKITFEKSTRYLTKHFDFPELKKARPSKKDALKFIKSFGDDFVITENRKGKNGNVFATYKEIYDVAFVITGNKLEWISIRIGENAPDFTQIEYEKYGPWGILGASYSVNRNSISIIPSRSLSKTINFKDTLFSTDIDVNRHFEGVYRSSGTCSGTYTFNDYSPKASRWLSTKNPNKKLPKGTYIYEGEFKKWYADGKGRLTFPNGDVIVGNWSQGYPETVDSMSINGCIYSGVVDRLYEPNGKGVAYCGDRTIEGNFEHLTKFTITGENYFYEGEINSNFEPDGSGNLRTDTIEVKDGYFEDGVLRRSGSTKILSKDSNGTEHIGVVTSGIFAREITKQLDNGAVYKGYVDNNDQYHKKGKITFPNGGYLNVEYDQGKFISASGELYKDDYRYTGTFDEQNQIHGSGMISKKTTKSYHILHSGDFIHGVYQGGLGNITDKDWSYTGAINKSLIPDGKGKKTYNNGQVLEGQFVNDVYQGGIAEIKFKDGTYSGEINKALQPHGEGTFKDKAGSTFTGQFSDGDPSGMGYLSRSDGSTFYGNFIGTEYQGGNGTITYSDGSKYNGKVNSNFQPHGDRQNYKGSLMDPTEFVYGKFENGRLLPGNGNKKYADGLEYAGKLDANGQPDGKGVFERRDTSNLFHHKSLIVTGVFKGFNSIGDVRLTYKSGESGFEYIGPVNSKFQPHGYGKQKLLNGGKWEYDTFKNGIKQ